MKFNIRTKLLLGFAALCGIIMAAGILGIIQINRLENSSLHMGEKDTPLVDAIDETKFQLAHAHLILEEVLAGDKSEKMADVLDKIDLAESYCAAIIEGGRVEGRQFAAVENTLVRNQVEKVRGYVNKFRDLSKARYQHYHASPAAGSAVDQDFDVLYRTIQTKLDILSQRHPEVGAEIQKMRYRLADTHLFLEEALSGDASVSPSDIQDEFDAMVESFAAYEANMKTADLGVDLVRLAKMVNYRVGIATSNSGAGSQLDAEFDLTFGQFIDETDKADDLIDAFIDISLQSVRTTHDRSVGILIGATLLCLLISLFIGLSLARHISLPIARLTAGLKKMARGNLEDEMAGIDPDRTDEIADILTSYLEVLHALREAAELADQVGQGNYEISITPKSDKDRLGQALKNMTARLKEISLINEEQFWLADTHAGLVEVIRGELDLTRMASNISSYLATSLAAQIASFYILVEGGLLKLTGAYAFELGSKEVADTLSMGEGLVGQAAVEKKLISITDLPTDYIRITSSLGDCRPQNLLVVPFMHENRVKGVIELGSCEKFSGSQLQLLHNVMESVAIAVHGAQIHSRINQLLAESQSQTEELQVQQEELQATNEELEEKTRELIKSEAQLQAQQEELRVTNEELEARSTLLEKQKAELEKHRNEIGKKARELEISSRYKSEFLANMSHELRTPLNSILILSQLLGNNKEKNLTAKQLEFATTINTSGNDLLQLINEVLDLSKVEAGKMQINTDAIDFEELLTEINHSFGPMAVEKNLVFKQEISESAPKKIITDPQRLRQILKNLISNALKFTDQGEVCVSVNRPAADTILTKSGLSPDSAVAIEVRDTGVGIAPDKQDIIFEAFQQEDGTTSRKYGGTGLGLSIAREMATFLGGEIKIDSTQGKGSTFTLILPLQIESRTPPAPEIYPQRLKDSIFQKNLPAAKATGQMPQQPVGFKDDREKINANDRVLLIIEDDANFAKIIMDLAHQRGFKCIMAEDGESGLHCADYYQPSAIILDIGLPRMNGWTVMDRLKDSPQTRHIPVHFISATDQPHDGMLKGAIGFLTKPVKVEDMQSALQRIEQVISRDVKNLLVVEDDPVQRQSIVDLIGNSDVVTTAVGSGFEALELIKSLSFDCMILDLGLTDITGFELLEKIKQDKAIPKLPIIIYTGRDLTEEQEDELKDFAESIIIKGVRSPDRLLAETTLFLHRVEADLPVEKQKMLSNLHDREALFTDRLILLVDDDMRNVFSISSVLQEKGMRVLVGKNGKEALNMLDTNPGIDIILMDIMMPEMDGFEAMRKIRSKPQFKNLPIIALTAKAMKGDRNRCIEAGANDYLAKPVEIERLFSLLRVWLYK